MNKSMMLIMVLLVFAASIGLSTAKADLESGEKTISVTGTATISVDPDLLVVEFGVESQEDTARKALESNSLRMNAVINTIKSVGISEDEIGTSRFDIRPVYGQYNESTGELPLIGYKVVNTVHVQTTNLNATANIIDNGVTAGANRVDSVYFMLSPQKQLELKDGLISDAILNAKTKAEYALAPLNHTIIGVKTVALSEYGMPQPLEVFYADTAHTKSAPFQSPIFSSDQDVITTAHVIFLIGSN